MKRFAIAFQLALTVHLALTACFVGPAGVPSDGPPPVADWSLVVSEGFESASALDRFEFSDPDCWTFNEQGALELLGGCEYTPPFRSPRNFALLNTPLFGSFILEVEAKQTGREYGHRDLCLFFVESKSKLVYVHLATTPDANAHNVFLVDGAARRNLLPPRTTGMDWGDTWHTLRLEHEVETGSFRVFIDGADHPEFEVTDTTVSIGRVGLGSFDDSGLFRNLRIWAP